MDQAQVHRVLVSLFNTLLACVAAVAAYNALLTFCAAWLASVLSFVITWAACVALEAPAAKVTTAAANATIAGATRATSFLRGLRARLEA